jgi:hypothetical protein
MAVIWIDSGRFGPPLWTPANITTALWLDAADASTVTTVSGAVSQWNDKSGNTRNASQGTAEYRPAYSATGLNRKGIVSFDGTNDFMLTAAANYAAINYFIVCKLTPKENSSVFTARTSPNANKGSASDINVGLGFGFAGIPGDSNMSNIGGNASYAMTNGLPVSSLTSFNNFAVGVNCPADWFLFDMAITATVSGAKTFCLGADIFASIGNRHLPCQVAELIVTSAALSATVRQQVQGYLAHKWGLTANLPNDHPYKTAAPIVQPPP